jgi:hypothetical protein
MSEKLMDIKQKIQEARETVQQKENVYEMLRSLKAVRGLNERFHTLLFQEIEKEDSIRTKWDLATRMSVIAREFDEKRRLVIERSSGRLLGLVFEKNQTGQS